MIHHFSDADVFVALPFAAALAFLLWFLWNVTRQLRRGRTSR